MSKLILRLALFALFISCNKSVDSQCFKGRFVGTIPCNNGEVIQFLSPQPLGLKSSTFLVDNDEWVYYTLLTDIPDELKDDEFFYFKLNGELNTFIHDNWCSYPAYAGTLKEVSTTPCKK